MAEDHIQRPLEALHEDLLVCIADKLGGISGVGSWSDAQNLRLVDHRFHTIVGQSAIKLRPRSDLTNAKLLRLSQLFRNAACLILNGCHNLNNESLRGLNSLFPRLRHISLDECTWLSGAGMAHLRGFSALEGISLFHCPSLTELPNSIGTLASLQYLIIQSCDELQSLPEGISRLTSLSKLCLLWCREIEALPEGIGCLSLLTYLHVADCGGLSKIPDSISGLVTLEKLHISKCHSLKSFPSAIGSLTALTELQLIEKSWPEELPESLSSLALLQTLDLRKSDSLAALPAGLSCLSALRVLDL